MESRAWETRHSTSWRFPARQASPLVERAGDVSAPGDVVVVVLDLVETDLFGMCIFVLVRRLLGRSASVRARGVLCAP